MAAGRPMPTVLPIILDVSNRKSVSDAGVAIEREFGHLDILINNAGYLSDFVRLLESDEDDYWQNWEVNYRGVYWVTKSLLPLMLKGGEKTIVNVSSIGAMGLAPGGSGYQISKHAILRFSEFLMVDYGDQVRSTSLACNRRWGS